MWSSTWGGGSGHTYNFTRKPNGTPDIDADGVREGKNLKALVPGIVLGGTIGRGDLEKAFADAEWLRQFPTSTTVFPTAPPATCK